MSASGSRLSTARITVARPTRTMPTATCRQNRAVAGRCAVLGTADQHEAAATIVTTMPGRRPITRGPTGCTSASVNHAKAITVNATESATARRSQRWVKRTIDADATNSDTLSPVPRRARDSSASGVEA